MKTILVGGTLATLTGLALAQDLGMKQHGDIRWACGGVGVEERAALAARAIPPRIAVSASKTARRTPAIAFDQNRYARAAFCQHMSRFASSSFPTANRIEARREPRFFLRLPGGC